MFHLVIRSLRLHKKELQYHPPALCGRVRIDAVVSRVIEPSEYAQAVLVLNIYGEAVQSFWFDGAHVDRRLSQVAEDERLVVLWREDAGNSASAGRLHHQIEASVHVGVAVAAVGTELTSNLGNVEFGDVQ